LFIFFFHLQTHNPCTFRAKPCFKDCCVIKRYIKKINYNNNSTYIGLCNCTYTGNGTYNESMKENV